MEGPHVVHSSSNSVPKCENSCAKDEQSFCSNMIENVDNMVLHHDSSCSYVLNEGINRDEENEVDDTISFQNSNEQFAGCHCNSDKEGAEQDKTSNTEEISSYELIPFDTTQKGCLRKFMSFPSSDVESSLLSCTMIDVASSSASFPIQNSFRNQLPANKRSVSLPNPSMPISAMKGGRAQNGALPSMDMHVKWAVDVYDPPATLQSHTVQRNNRQGPKSKKKLNNRKKKHNKGKNSLGSNSGKKLSNWENIGSLPLPCSGKQTLHRSCVCSGWCSGCEVWDYLFQGHLLICIYRPLE